MARNTRQLRKIQQALAAAGRPLTAQEILERAQPAVPTLGLATVYRTMNRLVQAGWVATVDLPDAPARFELSGKGHHHHFLCTTCEGVWDVEGCPRGVEELTPSRFELDAHQLVLYGRCERCSDLRPQGKL